MPFIRRIPSVRSKRKKVRKESRVGRGRARRRRGKNAWNQNFLESLLSELSSKIMSSYPLNIVDVRSRGLMRRAKRRYVKERARRAYKGIRC